MSSIIPFSFESHEVRTILEGDNVYWVGKDVCLALGYANPSDAIKQHCKGVAKRYPLMTTGGKQDVRVLDEPDVLRLIVSSTLPEAQRFERWVFEDVLPTIRKTGRYQHPAAQQHDAHELMTGSDMQNLTRLVWLMSHHFRHKDSVTQAIWFAFRACTNTPAPQRFQTRHIPLLAAEARRMFYLTRAVAELTAEAEKTLVKRIIRKGENAEKVIEEIRVALQKANDDDLQTADRYLGKWVEHEIRPLVERNQSPGAFYPECAESA